MWTEDLCVVMVCVVCLNDISRPDLAPLYQTATLPTVQTVPSAMY